MKTFNVNGQPVSFDGDGNMPLLWFLRENLKLKGTKFGCGIGSCGACTVHLDGRAIRSCVLPMTALGADSMVTTIEGLAKSGELHPVQKAWLAADVPQCGYCQGGQIMATVDLLTRIPNPSDADIDRNVGNLCRCGTYNRIRAAIHAAAASPPENARDD